MLVCDWYWQVSLILLSLPLWSLLSTVKDESAINTPAVAAAFAIKAYQAQDDSEISLEVSHSPTHLFLLLWFFFGCLNFSFCILYSYFSLNMLDKSCIASHTKHFLRHPHHDVQRGVQLKNDNLSFAIPWTPQLTHFIQSLFSSFWSKLFTSLSLLLVLLFVLICHSFFHVILHRYFTFNPLKPFLSCHDLSILFGFPSVGRCVVSHDEMNPLFIIRVMFCVFIMKVVIKKGMRIQFAWE